MKKILNFLANAFFGISDTEHGIASFSDLEPIIKSKFQFELLFVGVGCAGAVGIGLITRSLHLFIYVLIIDAIFLLVASYKILITLSGQLAMIKGIFYSDSSREASEKASFFSSLSEKVGRDEMRPYIIIMDETGTFFKVYTPKRFHAEEGNEIVVYTPLKSIFKQNNDTLVINNVYHIVVTNTASHMLMADSTGNSENEDNDLH